MISSRNCAGIETGLFGLILFLTFCIVRADLGVCNSHTVFEICAEFFAAPYANSVWRGMTVVARWLVQHRTISAAVRGPIAGLRAVIPVSCGVPGPDSTQQTTVLSRVRTQPVAN